MNDNRDWIDVLRERLLDYEEPVPEGLFDRIMSTLEARKKARRRRRILLWSTAAAAAVAVGIFAGVNLVDNSIDKGDFIAQDSQEHRASKPQTPSSSVDIVEVPVSSGKLIAFNATPSPAKLHPEAAVEEPKASEPVLSETEIQPVDAPESRPDDKPELNVGPEKDVPSFETTHDGEDWSGYSSATDDGLSGNWRKIVAGLSVSSSAVNSQDISTVESSVFYMGLAPVATSDGDGTSFLPSGNGFMTKGSRISALDYAAPQTRAVSEPVTKDENHRRPLRASLRLAYPLTDALWLESGLTYSMLYSTFTTSSGATVTEDVQTLRYLGIPLNLKADLLDRRMLDVYVSGGGMAEKCLSGLVKSTTTVSGTPLGETSSRNLYVKPLQWSLNAAAGLQLNVKETLGIYAEPGVSYHFASNANVRSIYTQHPLDFVMTFGARFSFR
ncbi:MAG: hypothetical protein IJ205_03180 [Bacteroidales bacterium]|nr:hypothetical protein [Bacteroidales bacterium]